MAQNPIKRDNSRFQSFAEQWVLARAQHFRVGYEEEDAYNAVLAARSIYNNLVIQSESPALIDNQREKEWLLEQSRLMQANKTVTMQAGATQAPPNHNPKLSPPDLAVSGGISALVRTIMGKESKNGSS